VQLDDRALFLMRWRDLLRTLLERDAKARGHGHDEARAVLAGWSGRAVPADAAYRLVHAFRAQVELRVFFALVAPARKQAPGFEFQIPSSFEGPLWRVLQAAPAQLLPARYADWDALLLESLRAAEQGPPACKEVRSCDWGTVNRVRVTHPLSRALPALARWIDMPAVSVPGGREDMPRVQGPDFGASERFSVSPGHEAQGYFHMPGGQSGHPLSAYYRGDFQAWAQGVPAPFLPGPAQHTLVLGP
jgi:penicillin amidase